MMHFVGALTGLRRLMRPRGAPGGAPGVLEAGPRERHTTLRAIAYGPSSYIEREIDSFGDIHDLISSWQVVWIDVDGFGDLDKLSELGQVCNLHPLALEDAVGCRQRPKVERYAEHTFIVVLMVSLAEHLETEQLSIFLKNKVVVTLQGGLPGDSLDPVRARIREGRGRIRTMDVSYLAHAIVDAAIDYYFPVLDELGSRLERIERGVLTHNTQDAPAQIYSVKHDLLSAQRLIRPLRDAVASLSRDQDLAIPDEVRQYFRDCHDHAVQLTEVVESYRDIANGLLDLHFSTMSQRMNEVMKLLTLVATLFIPLTFIAGIYGMNFDPRTSPWNMPEIRWSYGYPAVLALMAVIAVGLLLYYRSRGWLK